MNLRDMAISTRLAVGFAAMGALVALLGAVALWRLGDIQEHATRVAEDRHPKIMRLVKIGDEVDRIARATRNLFIMTDASDLKAQRDEIAAADKAISEAFAVLERTLVSEKGKALLAAATAARAADQVRRDAMLADLHSGKVEAARAALLGEMRPAQLADLKGLDALRDFEESLLSADAAETEAAALRARNTVLALVGVAGVLGLVLALGIIRSTTRPLAQAIQVARAVARGDLDLEFDARGTNETGLLLAALHDLKTRLATIVGGVRAGAEGVATASGRIARAHDDLSARTEAQARALERTAASMKALSGTLRRNADKARQAHQLAQGASGVAAQGGEVVGRFVATLKDIDDSSKKIADIVGTIDAIAFRTRRLALEAADEAARAGAQGRGLAVMAGEVLSLAGRSAEAAREIRSLISARVERVEQGTQLVDPAGTTMAEVVGAIRRVTDLIGEIGAASVEPSAGVAPVGDAPSRMDQATRQNAARVDEGTAAAGSLEELARQLVRAVAVFRLEAGAGRAVQAPSPDAAPVAPARPAPWVGQERRGPERATNVARLPLKHNGPARAPAADASTSTGAEHDWTSF